MKVIRYILLGKHETLPFCLRFFSLRIVLIFSIYPREKDTRER